MSDQDIKPVNKNRAKKEAVVADLSEQLEKAKGVVFTNYQGLTHKQLEELKKAIKPLDADFAITKNTLLKLALESSDYSLQTTAVDSGQSTVDQFEGPTGTLFLFGDVVEPLKRLAKTIKDFSLPTIKFAILDGKVTSAEDVIKISALPSREVLLTQVAISLKSPISGLHRALNWNLQKFVMTLNAIAMAKPAVAVAAPTVPTAEPASEPVAQTPTEAPVEETPAEPEAQTEPEATVEPTTETEVTESEAPVQEETKSEEVKTEGGEN